MKAPLGVNVVGFFRAEFGQGEAARRLVAALERTGLEYTTVTYERIPHRQEHPFIERDGELFPANVVSLNAEHLVQFALDSGRDLLRNRYSAGLWFWETSRFPKQFRHAFDYVDEVWVPSDFVGEAVRARDGKAGADLSAAGARAAAARARPRPTSACPRTRSSSCSSSTSSARSSARTRSG